VACNRIPLLLVACAFISLGEAAAAAAQELPAQAKPVQGLLVPVPKEIFRTLDQFQNANWRAVQRSEIVRWKSQGDQVQVALLLGVVVGEGFIAMESQDVKEIKDVGQRVLVLGRALGVEQTALRRSRSIIDHAERNDWAGARKEWDNVLTDLEQGMIALKSEPLSHLVSLSGWLRGTEALSILVMQDYSANRAELLRQTAILDYLEQQLLAINKQTQRHTLVTKMLAGLRKIRTSLQNDGNVVTEKTVHEIGDICRGLVVAISQHSAS